MTNGETQNKDHARTDANKLLAERFAHWAQGGAFVRYDTVDILRESGRVRAQNCGILWSVSLGIAPPTRTLRRPNCNDAAQAAFIAKAKELAPKYHTELLPPSVES